jgi:hypothetical protein
MKENRFKVLPLGSVKARGFLLRQLTAQRDGITGHMELYPDYGKDSGWLGGAGESWERGPYYVRGLVALAYCLGDKTLINRAKKWIDYTLSSQTEDGNFGPQLPGAGVRLEKRRELVRRERWAKMPMLYALRDYYEASSALGRSDMRVPAFFEKYFRFELASLKAEPLDSWAKARGADNVELVLWYYDNISKEKWLTELAQLLLGQTFDWSDCFEHTKVRHHVVDTAEGFKYPFIAYRVAGTPEPTRTLEQGMEHIRSDHGRIDDLPNADEDARDNLFTRGTESCAVAEAMLSMETAGLLRGDTQLYDYLETYAYNSLPNCFDYDLTRHCYFQLENQAMACLGTHDFDCDHGDDCAYGAPTGFGCCFSNIHMAYPKFVQNMWVRTSSGLAAVCYGENSVKTDIKGKTVSFTQQTRYPFGDNVRLTYGGERARFSLLLRIPRWSRSVSLRINNVPTQITRRNDYVVVRRDFSPSDTLDISFDSAVTIVPWHFGAAAVRKGAVIYCLPIRERIREVSDVSRYREIKQEPRPEAATQEFFPLSKWNYALDVTKFVCREGGGDIRLTPQAPPSSIIAWGIPDDNWGFDGNKAAPLPNTRVIFDEGLLRELTLIPYACTRLKISLFPKVYHIEKAPGHVLSCSAERWKDCVQLDFETLPEADEYLLEVHSAERALYLLPRNTYNGGTKTFVKRERFTLSVPDTARFSAQLFAFSGSTVTARSLPINI